VDVFGLSYWNTGQVGMYDPASRNWREWKLPGNAHAYAVWVDDKDKVWLTDWSTNAIVRFDPLSENSTACPRIGPGPMYARCWADRARYGVPNRA
jgi:virginiamycin B lyase